MTGQKGVKNVKYLSVRRKSTKARKCKVEGCKKCVREENKSGYCNFHVSKSPESKMRAIRASKKDKEQNIAINIDREIFSNYADFCEQYGFNKKKKLGLIIKEFLKLNDAQEKESEQ